MKFASVVVAALISLGIAPGAFAWDLPFMGAKKPKEVVREHKEKMSAGEKSAARQLRQAVDRDVEVMRQRAARKAQGFRPNQSRVAPADYAISKRRDVSKEKKKAKKK